MNERAILKIAMQGKIPAKNISTILKYTTQNARQSLTEQEAKSIHELMMSSYKGIIRKEKLKKVVMIGKLRSSYITLAPSSIFQNTNDYNIMLIELQENEHSSQILLVDIETGEIRGIPFHGKS